MADPKQPTSFTTDDLLKRYGVSSLEELDARFQSAPAPATPRTIKFSPETAKGLSKALGVEIGPEIEMDQLQGLVMAQALSSSGTADIVRKGPAKVTDPLAAPSAGFLAIKASREAEAQAKTAIANGTTDQLTGEAGELAQRIAGMRSEFETRRADLIARTAADPRAAAAKSRIAEEVARRTPKDLTTRATALFNSPGVDRSRDVVISESGSVGGVRVEGSAPSDPTSPDFLRGSTISSRLPATPATDAAAKRLGLRDTTSPDARKQGLADSKARNESFLAAFAALTGGPTGTKQPDYLTRKFNLLT